MVRTVWDPRHISSIFCSEEWSVEQNEISVPVSLNSSILYSNMRKRYSVHNPKIIIGCPDASYLRYSQTSQIILTHISSRCILDETDSSNNSSYKGTKDPLSSTCIRIDYNDFIHFEYNLTKLYENRITVIIHQFHFWTYIQKAESGVSRCYVYT